MKSESSSWASREAWTPKNRRSVSEELHVNYSSSSGGAIRVGVEDI